MTTSHRRIFLTGGTGYVGSAVAQELVARGHRVSALVRAPARAAALPPGCNPVIGDLANPAAWLEVAAEADVAVHTGFQYAGGTERPAPDWIATSTLLTLAQSGACRLGRLVYTSNAYLLGDHPARPVDEDAEAMPTGHAPLSRAALERVVATSGVAAVIRLGMVYGAAIGPMGGTIPRLFDALAASEPLDAVERLTGRWSLVHVGDVAALYRAVAEAGHEASGVFHATDGAPLRAADVLALARDALLRVGASSPSSLASMKRALQGEHLGRLARDVAVVPARALALGWRPEVRSFREGALQTAAEWRAERGRA